MSTHSTSSNAWGKSLVDPILVDHGGTIVMLARESECENFGPLYHRFLRTGLPAAEAEERPWTDWQRLDLAPMERRIPGAELVTVPNGQNALEAAAAPFRAISDGEHIVVFRQSNVNTLVVDRLRLVEVPPEEGSEEGAATPTYALERAWEPRYRRSGNKDVPAGEHDELGSYDESGQPFLEPTLELDMISVHDGCFDVALVPTATAGRSVWHIVGNITEEELSELSLWTIAHGDHAAFDLRDAVTSFTLDAGKLGNAKLSGAPALAFFHYQVHAAERDAGGAVTKLVGTATPGEGRLMIAVATKDQGILAWDASVGADGSLPGLEAWPAPAQIDAGDGFGAPAKDRISHGTVLAMRFGRLSAKGAPHLLRSADGRVRLYFVDADGHGRFLQYDTRTTPGIVRLPWRTTTGETGDLELVSSSTIDRASVTIMRTEDSFLSMASVTIEYGEGLAKESWYGVPRDLEGFVATLNGEASYDVSDPAVCRGRHVYYDDRAQEDTPPRTSLYPIGQDSKTGHPDGLLFFVARRPDVALTRTSVEDVSDKSKLVTFVFSFTTNPDPGSHIPSCSFEQRWPNIPKKPSGLQPIFDGTNPKYDYGDPAMGDWLFPLSVDPENRYALLLVGDPNPDRTRITIEVSPVEDVAHHCNVTVREDDAVVATTPEPIERSQKAVGTWLIGAAEGRFRGYVVDPRGGSVIDQRATDSPQQLRMTTSLFAAVQTTPESSGQIEPSKGVEVVQPWHRELDPDPDPEERPKGMGYMRARVVDRSPDGKIPWVKGEKQTKVEMSPGCEPRWLSEVSPCKLAAPMNVGSYEALLPGGSFTVEWWSKPTETSNAGEVEGVEASSTTTSGHPGGANACDYRFNSRSDDYRISHADSMVSYKARPSSGWRHNAVVVRSPGGLWLGDGTGTGEQASFHAWCEDDGALDPAGETWSILTYVALESLPKSGEKAVIAARPGRWELSIDSSGTLTFRATMTSQDLSFERSTFALFDDERLGKVVRVGFGLVSEPQKGKEDDKTDANTSWTPFWSVRAVHEGSLGWAAGPCVELSSEEVMADSKAPVILGATRDAQGSLLHRLAGVMGPTMFRTDLPLSVQDAGKKGMLARFWLDEQAGRLARAESSKLAFHLGSTSQWTTLAAMGRIMVHEDGRPCGAFAHEHPVQPGTPGFRVGSSAADVRVWSIARTTAEIAQNRFRPLRGDEPGLVGYWPMQEPSPNIADATGHGHEGTCTTAATRDATDPVPVGSEGPWVADAYATLVGSWSLQASSRPAVIEHSAVSVDEAGRPSATMQRLYAFVASDDPSAETTGLCTRAGYKVGDLGLTLLGQVQLAPSLVGFIEGAPPVPSENLSLPYYDGSSPAAYIGATSVTLSSRDIHTVSFDNTQGRQTSSTLELGYRFLVKLQTEAGFGVMANVLDLDGKIEAGLEKVVTSELTAADTSTSEWTRALSVGLALSGDWEPARPSQADYVDPSIGRRFLPESSGVAVVESLIADVYAVEMLDTRAAVGAVAVPNLAIGPQINLLRFPLAPTYVKQGTLDGRIGVGRDPDYIDTESRSYYDPEDAYATRVAIDRKQTLLRTQAEQVRAALRGGDASTKSAAGASFVERKDDELVPRQGIANAYMWSANAAFYEQEDDYMTTYETALSLDGSRSLGGTIGFELSFTGCGVGGGYNLSWLSSTVLELDARTAETHGKALSLTTEAKGEGYLRTWDQDTQSYRPGLAPGKVKQYGYMSFYLPPSLDNSSAFASKIIDAEWLKSSADPDAVALRRTRLQNPAWRVFHRVTYIDRVPAQFNDKPTLRSAPKLRPPTGLEDNARLLELVARELGGPTPTRDTIAAAVVAVLDPANGDPKLDVEWWKDLVKKKDPVVKQVVTAAVAYVLDGYVTKVLPLPKDPESEP